MPLILPIKELLIEFVDGWYDLILHLPHSFIGFRLPLSIVCAYLRKFDLEGTIRLSLSVIEHHTMRCYGLIEHNVLDLPLGSAYNFLDIVDIEQEELITETLVD